MRRELVPLLFLAFSAVSISAQVYSDLGPENNFQSANNPYYWKNKLPYTGYWQQDVQYKIKATLDETTDIITGEENLTYTNNSPDTLYFVYFNLYQNAFQPGSYLDNLQRNNGVKPVYGKYERDKLGTVIDEIKTNGKGLKTQLDNTVIKVIVDSPILPNAKKVFRHQIPYIL